MNTRPKILAVDDKPENLVALELVLKDLDVEIIKATSGNEALTKTLHHEFSLALLDIHMPGMDGYELAEILRNEEKTAQLPFIFISAIYTDNLNVFKGYDKGAFSYITKPFQPEILINKVKFFIEKHQQEIALYHMNIDLEKKNMELQRINNELESFSYSVSHDLRSPLRALIGYSSLLLQDYRTTMNEDAKKLIDDICYNGNKMATLIDNLLEFSKLGRKELKKSPLNMQELVEGTIHEINKSSVHKAHIKILDLPSVSGDYSLLFQVWYNLISNAIKYSSKNEKPEITIGSVTQGNENIYFIRDNGAGFNMKYAHRLFGVFQRLHHAEDFEGTGIGLAIIQRIISRHGGRVWAEAEENKGATFYFTLPG